MDLIDIHRRISADPVIRYLDMVSEANHPTVTMYGMAGGLQVFRNLTSWQHMRARRADCLRFIRNAVVSNGRCNTRRAMLAKCAALRREERHLIHVEASERHLSNVSIALSKMITAHGSAV